MYRVWYGAIGAAAVLILIAVSLLAWARMSAPHVVALGTPIQHDDFFFTVTHVQRRTWPDGSARYWVKVRVQNRAKIADYRWRDSIAYVRAFDAKGYGHDFYLHTSRAFTLAAGHERTTQLDFAIPRGYSSANLRFWDGVFMGDAFNGAAYGKAIVPLEAYNPPFGT